MDGTIKTTKNSQQITNDFPNMWNEVEIIAEYIKEKAQHRGWENAEYMAADKFGKKKH